MVLKIRKLNKIKLKEKGKEKCMKNYGVENPAKSQKIQEKIKQTNLVRYGVERPLQNPRHR